MNIPVRRFLGTAVGVLALLGPMSAKGQGQFRPPIFNPNPYVNPFAAQGLFNAAVMGRVLQARAGLAMAGFTHPLAATAGYGYGLNLGARYGAFASPYARMGYASMLNNAYGNSGLGYGSLMNGGGYGLGGGGMGLAGTLLSGAGYGYGLGYGSSLAGTQWMMNPYQGYLQGAADITRSSAQYYQGIQQAKLSRQEAIRSSLETRRAMIEEADWERAHMPDPEKLRQQALERELTTARTSPPLTDIWSARSLNALLRHLIAQQGEGVRGPKVPLNEDTVSHINLTAGDTRGNVGLLKDNGNLEWPESLQGGVYKETRERLNALMKQAYKSVSNGNNPGDATLNDLQDNYRKMQATLLANVEKLTPDEYIEARRYMGDVSATITALQDPNVVNLFNDNGKAKSNNVAELVRYMRDKGLQFAPATTKDQAAYVALYHALAAFDAGLPRLASSSPGNAENK